MAISTFQEKINEKRKIEKGRKEGKQEAAHTEESKP